MLSGKLLIGGVAALAVLGIRARGRQPRPDEVDELREELRRELARLAGGDIKASRTPRESASPPG
ncbi:MAG: hypothetical protein ACRDM7_16655 [Thermoleophilaceae bacterium]